MSGDVRVNPVDVKALLNPSRCKGESMEEYKSRRYRANLYTRVVLGGKTFWDTTKQGIYRKPKEVPIS